MIILVTCMILLLVPYYGGYYKYLAVHETELTPSFFKKVKSPSFDDYGLY